MSMQQQIRDLQAEVRRLSARIDQRPIVHVPSLKYYSILVDKGNTLETGQFGVKYVTPNLTTVPSAYDPTVTDSFIDGIGRGTLYINGVAQANKVLLVNDDHGSFRNALVQGDVVWCHTPIYLLVGAGPSTVTVYPVS